jgi:hypothetical protein
MRSRSTGFYRAAAALGSLAGALALVVALGAAPAQAHGSGHGSKTCSSTHYVVTESITAGNTTHHKKISGTWHHGNTFVAPSSNGYWSWGGPNLPVSVQDWGVTAEVLESHWVSCWLRPV